MSNQQKKAENLLSVIFSFRNEEDVLPELIRRTRVVLQSEKDKGVLSGYELIFVNDASTDRSQEILLAELSKHPDIRLINMSRCFGVAPCILAGMQHARGNVVIYMDADLQDPPELIPHLLETWETQQVDVVHTVRKAREGESTAKIFLTRIGYLMLNSFSSISIPQEAGDFKLLSRRAVNHLLALPENRPFIRGLVCWIGFKQTFIEYQRHKRYAGKTKFPVLGWRVLSNFLGSALISFSAVPLKIATFLGLFTILFDFILIIHAFYEKLHGTAIPGWTAIMIAVLFTGGAQLFCIGVIGVYLDSIHEQTKNRPNFIVESTFGFTGFPANKQKEKLTDNDLSKADMTPY